MVGRIMGRMSEVRATLDYDDGRRRTGFVYRSGGKLEIFDLDGWRNYLVKWPEN